MSFWSSSTCLEQIERVVQSASWDRHVEAESVSQPFPRRVWSVKEIPAVDGLDTEAANDLVQLLKLERDN